MDEKSTHQDFARRLMEASEHSAGDGEGSETAAEKVRPPRVAAPPAPVPVRLRGSTMSTSIRDLRRQRLLLLSMHILTAGLVALLAVVAAAIFVVFVLSDEDWTRLVPAGAAAAAGLSALVLLQVLPAAGQGGAGPRLAQLETAYLSIEKSIEFWEDHLRFQRQSTGLADAAEVERAVQSITASSERVMKLLVAAPPSAAAATAPPATGAARAAASPASRY